MQDFRKPKPDPSSEIESDLKALTKTAKTLNDLTNELTVHVEQIEGVLSPLNLGLRVFVIAEEDADEREPWTHYLRLLYDKNGGKWGLTIDEFDEHAGNPDSMANHQSWPFKDAPRGLRLKVVDKIPDLLKVLVEASDNIASQAAVKVAAVREISNSLRKPAIESSGK